jgi:crotonobetainyl-CoA:carnitine CoA-transferase CaiB-like acyl-CoA transferase
MKPVSDSSTPRDDQHERDGTLAGVRVLEFCALIAGPSSAKYLADHGAEVIKIERFPDGDVSRVTNRLAPGRSAMFVQHNVGKKGLCIDLTKPEGLAIAKDLVRQSDVVIEAFTPGVMAKLGLGYEDLKALNPRIILCSISGFGQSGTNAMRPGYAHIAHSMTGWLAMQFLHRDPPERPRGPGIAVADVVTGITAFGAICAALFKRERTGRGERIDVALFDSLFAANDETLQRCLIDGVVNPGYHPVHQTRDGYVTANIGPDFRAWQNICRAMGRPELLDDPRFSTLPAVQENRVAATALLTDWLATLTSDEADRILTEHHVVVGVLKTVPQAVRQPQVLERQMIVPVDDPVLGTIDVINAAPKFADARVGVRGPAPTLGQHNTSVLRELLGYDEAAIAALTASGVLRQETL